MAFIMRQGGLAVAVFAIALAVRYALIERPELGWACQALEGAPFWCPLRAALIVTLEFGALGWLSLAAAVWGLAGGGRGVVGTAILAGTAGLVLFAAGASALGLILGLVRSLRA